MFLLFLLPVTHVASVEQMIVGGSDVDIADFGWQVCMNYFYAMLMKWISYIYFSVMY